MVKPGSLALAATLTLAALLAMPGAGRGEDVGFVGLSGTEQAAPAASLDLTDVSEKQTARLLLLLDQASAEGASARGTFIARLEEARSELGSKLYTRVRELLDKDPATFQDLVARRDDLLLQARGSELHQSLVVPAELAEAPRAAEAVRFWSDSRRSSPARAALAKASGLKAEAVTPGPALARALRSTLLGHVAAGRSTKAKQVREAMREATHAVRAAAGQVQVAAAAAEGAAGASSAAAGAAWPHARQAEGLDERILGAMVYLDDTQIRDRVGKLSCTIDSSELGEGCTSKFVYNSALTVRDAELPMLFDASVRNNDGQWASFIHLTPKIWDKVTFSKRAKLGIIQDSNLFITAFVVYPLMLVDDGTGVVDRMIDGGMQFLGTCKRGEAYAFWPRLPEDMSPYDVIGPANTPYEPLKWLGRFLLNPKVAERIKKMPPKHTHMSYETFTEFMKPEVNPAGMKALVNIPADADDTAVTVAAQVLYSARRGGAPAVDRAALEAMARFRDVNRTKEEGTDAWKGKDSGGYLTWIKDEDLPTLTDQATGAIPLEVNNVDSVVQANALFGLTLAGRQDLPGYRECMAIVARAANEHLWPEANLYYPQRMIFPYCASRAWRDAGAQDPSLRPAMKKLLLDVLKEQVADGTTRLVPPRRPGGAFPGKPDESMDLSTALACCCLMNLGEELAKEAGVLAQYRTALDRGIQFLLRQARSYEVRDRSTFAYSGARPKGYSWQEGLFFSSGTEAMAYWRSEPYTVATVLEALLKYRLGHDKHGRTLPQCPHVKLQPPAAGGAWTLAVVDPS